MDKEERAKTKRANVSRSSAADVDDEDETRSDDDHMKTLKMESMGSLQTGQTVSCMAH